MPDDMINACNGTELLYRPEKNAMKFTKMHGLE